MCGIFGTLKRPIENPSLILDDLRHRGPDTHGVLAVEPLTLLHTRLAIQELGPGGHQPMQRGRWVLAFNGEIYNHHDLRQRYGLACKSGSDAETLLHLWERLGVGMLPQLDGMFALALFDVETGQLWLARDRFGQKPLYVWQSGQELAFCSELRTLQRQIPLDINREALSRFCQTGYFLPGETPYRNVRMVRPGQVEQIDAQTLHCVTRHWNSDELPVARQRRPEAVSVSTFNQVLTKSICEQLDATDREVGTLLSGGIDSGLITAIAAKHHPGLCTFTMSFSHGRYDEAPLARLVAKRFQTRHTEVQLPEQHLADEVLQILPRYGEPFMDSSALPTHWVAKAAREQVPVVLVGDGADELFGGYRRYMAAHLGLYAMPRPVSLLLNKTKHVLPYPSQKQSRYNQLYRLLNLTQQSGANRYLAATTDVLSGYEPVLIDPAPLDLLDRWIGETSDQSALRQMQFLDLNLLFPGDLLKKMDVATMAHGLEARSPFLSNTVASFAFSLSDDQKIGWRNGRLLTKALLRNLARQHLPAMLITQPKRGFEVPLRQWLDGPLRELSYEYLQKPALSDTLISRSFIDELLRKPHRFPPEKRAKIIWMVLSIEIWYRSLYRHG